VWTDIVEAGREKLQKSGIGVKKLMCGDDVRKVKLHSKKREKALSTKVKLQLDLISTTHKSSKL